MCTNVVLSWFQEADRASQVFATDIAPKRVITGVANASWTQTYLAGAGRGSCSSVSFTRAAHGTSEACKGEEGTFGIARGKISDRGRERTRACRRIIRRNITGAEKSGHDLC